MHQSLMVTDVLLRRSTAASFYRFIGSASLLLPRLCKGFNGMLTMSGGLLRFDKQLRDDENRQGSAGMRKQKCKCREQQHARARDGDGRQGSNSPRAGEL